jgi:hypothetical protein
MFPNTPFTREILHGLSGNPINQNQLDGSPGQNHEF